MSPKCIYNKIFNRKNCKSITIAVPPDCTVTIYVTPNHDAIALREISHGISSGEDALLAGMNANALNTNYITHKDELNMNPTLDSIKQQVADEKTVIDGAVALMGGLKAKLDAAIATGDMAKVQEISDAIGANSSELAAAVAANTVAA